MRAILAFGCLDESREIYLPKSRAGEFLIPDQWEDEDSTTWDLSHALFGIYLDEDVVDPST